MIQTWSMERNIIAPRANAKSTPYLHVFLHNQAHQQIIDSQVRICNSIFYYVKSTPSMSSDTRSIRLREPSCGWIWQNLGIKYKVVKFQVTPSKEESVLQVTDLQVWNLSLGKLWWVISLELTFTIFISLDNPSIPSKIESQYLNQDCHELSITA